MGANHKYVKVATLSEARYKATKLVWAKYNGGKPILRPDVSPDGFKLLQELTFAEDMETIERIINTNNLNNL